MSDFIRKNSVNKFYISIPNCHTVEMKEKWRFLVCIQVFFHKIFTNFPKNGGVVNRKEPNYPRRVSFFHHRTVWLYCMYEWMCVCVVIVRVSWRAKWRRWRPSVRRWGTWRDRSSCWRRRTPPTCRTTSSWKRSVTHKTQTPWTKAPCTKFMASALITYPLPSWSTCSKIGENLWSPQNWKYPSVTSEFLVFLESFSEPKRAHIRSHTNLDYIL